MTINGAQETITKAVTAWEGVTVQPHRFGGVEYVIGKREIGHIHGDHLVVSHFRRRCVMKLCWRDRRRPTTFCQTPAGSAYICAGRRM
jgi:hypothetical protein